jgi:phosphopantothenoylcysteine decarboxylase / phosphopantothenate---cysteine ligase
LVSGPTHIAVPDSVTCVRVESAREMLAACQNALPADIFVAVAAVADWRAADAGHQKLKLKSGAEPAPLILTENPDILATIAAQGAHRPALVIGFAAETHDVATYATAKLDKKKCDWIVANDVSGDVMGGDHNAVSLVTHAGIEAWPRASKTDVAEKLAQRIVAHFMDKT